jgi:hypothetical protein
MRLKKLTVCVSYRINTECAHTPAWKALRARVRQETAEGPIYGRDLTRQGITSLDMGGCGIINNSARFCGEV